MRTAPTFSRHQWISLPEVAMLLVLLSGGCGAPRQQPAELQWRQVTEDGIPVTVTEGALDATREALRLTLVQRLIENPADEEGLLQNPTGLVVDNAGRYYILDSGTRRLVVFDSLGHYERFFGGRGAGPGEFQAMQLLHFADPVLVIWDPAQRRTTRYRTDGTLLDVQSSPDDRRLRFFPLHPGRSLVWESPTENRDGIAWTTARARILDATGDPIGMVETGPAPTWAQEIREGPIPGIIESIETPMAYVGSPLILYDPAGGLVACEGDLPEIRWYDLQGELQRIARIEGSPRLVTAEVRRAHTEWHQERENERAARSGRPPDQVSESLFPERIGFGATGSFVDDRGFVWVRGVWSLEELPVGVIAYHLFDPGGRYLGVCRLGRESSSPAPSPAGVTVSEGRLLALIYDEDYGGYVPTIYRIEPAAEEIIYP